MIFSKLILKFKKNQKISLLSLLFLAIILIPLILLLSRWSKPVSYRSKAELQRTPDPRCSLEVNVIETIINTPIPPTITAKPANTGVPVPTSTPTSTPKPTNTVTPFSCPPVPVLAGCPSPYPTPAAAYPYIKMTSISYTDDTGAQKTASLPFDGVTLKLKAGTSYTIFFDANKVYGRKTCYARCDTINPESGCDSSWNCQVDSNETLLNSSYGLTRTSSLPAAGQYYAFMVAGYSLDKNYACSSTTFYTGYNPPCSYGSMRDPISYCNLTGTSCGNRKIYVEVK